MKIKILDNIECKAMDQEAYDLCRKALQYPDIWWKRGLYKMEPKTTTKYLVNKKGIFLSGFIDRVNSIAESEGVKIEWEGKLNLPEPKTISCLPGITLRDDQKRLVKNAFDNGRGVLKAPTRTGKTVIAGAIINCLEKGYCLFLVHTLDLLEQTADEFRKFGFDVGVVGGGKLEGMHNVTVATRQTFVNNICNLTNAIDYSLVIIDETHHVRDLNSQYAKILTELDIPYRFGFTATLPEKIKEQLILEGLIGPVIGEVTQKEAQELNILAETKVKIVKVPKEHIDSGIKTYAEAYTNLIVRNRKRNKFIMDVAVEHLEKGETVLIIVRRVAHGMYIQDMFERFTNYEVPFLCGDVDSETKNEIKKLKTEVELMDYFPEKGKEQENKNKREWLEFLLEIKEKIQENSKNRKYYKEQLDDRKVKCIIATKIFNEGINIPTLNTVILAGAGKSEVETIQSGSRAFTKSEGKKYGLLIDFFDPNHKTFVNHFGHRVSYYCEIGWL